MEKYCPTCKKVRSTETKLFVCKEINKNGGYALGATNQPGQIVTFPVQICHTCGTFFVSK